MQRDDRLAEEAVAWAVRTGDAGFSDWEAFTQWLEESPDHAAAYDRVTAAVAEAAEGLPPRAHIPANDDPRIRVSMSRRWFGGAIAASLAAVIVFGVWRGDGTYTEETAPGETRVIALDDGSRIQLAGASVIELDRGDPRFARLEVGRALFTIEHDEGNPFRVRAGEDTLIDLGTVFDVSLDDERLAVAVGEGEVMFNPDKQAVRLAAGDALRSRRGSDAYETSKVAASQVGEWTDGRLTFDNAGLDEVAAELSRATGATFKAPPSSSARLSGSILVDPVRRDPRSVASLLGVTVRRDAEAWVIDIP
jgi:transmembrane sensor